MQAATAVLFVLALLPASFFFGVGMYLFLAAGCTRSSGRAFVEWFRAIDPSMNARAKWVWWWQVACTSGLLLVTSGCAFGLTLASLVATAEMTLVVVFGTAPLNRRAGRWRPDAPPVVWAHARERWLWLHTLRAVAATLAFVLLLAAARVDATTRQAATTPAEAARAGTPAPLCWEATVLLPLADNSGRSFPDETWNQALAGLVTPFGGGTLGEPQEGCWVDASGRLVREWVRPVVISFAPNELELFRQTVQTLGRELGQEAVYVRFGETRVELIR